MIIPEREGEKNGTYPLAVNVHTSIRTNTLVKTSKIKSKLSTKIFKT